MTKPMFPPKAHMTPIPGVLSCAVLALAALWCNPASAQTPEPLVEASKVLHPWEVPTPRLKSEAYFTNLKDGDQIETPFLLKFGLSGGWGLAPVAKPAGGKSGHHHLLVNRDLPLDFKQALPFDDQYIHFGLGQMETVLTFEPGVYTLRMLLADSKHLPHFVYSKPATITVTRKNPVDPETLKTRGISMMLPGPTVSTPFRIQFHASGLNVGMQAQALPNSGHFRLVARGGRETATMDFVNGQTEVYLSPPAGDYSLQLQWVSNQPSDGEPVEPVNARLTVR